MSKKVLLCAKCPGNVGNFYNPRNQLNIYFEGCRSGSHKECSVRIGLSVIKQETRVHSLDKFTACEYTQSKGVLGGKSLPPQSIPNHTRLSVSFQALSASTNHGSHLWN
jgi:hypothetical protein